MKKLLFVLICLFTVNAFAGAFDLQQNKTFAKEQDKLAAELNNIQKNTCNLYGLIEQELLNYYGKENLKDFYDPNHQTGWFRVYDFLTWLKKNEKELIESLSLEANAYNLSEYKNHLEHPLSKYCSLDTPEIKGFLGAFLGKEYLLSRYPMQEEPSYKYIPILHKNRGGWWAGFIEQEINTGFLPEYIKKAIGLPDNMKCRYIYFSFDERGSFSNFINMGIHETMHMLGKYYNMIDDTFPEIFSIYAQLAYALPVKKEENFYNGARNLYNSVQFFPYEEVSIEYTDAFYAYIQFKDLHRMDIKDMAEFSKKIPAKMWNAPFFWGPCLDRVRMGNRKMKEIKDNADYQILSENDSYVYYIFKFSEEKGDEIAGSCTKFTDKYGETVCEYNHFIVRTNKLNHYIESNSYILPKNRQFFTDLADEYVKIALTDAIYSEHNVDKYEDITKHPLKYVLKENKDIPPIPEGYI